MKKTIPLILILLVWTNVTYRLLAQSHSYVVSEDTSWKNLYLLGMSNDNQWVHLYSQIPFGKSIISLKNIESGVAFDFKEAYGGNFSGNSKWFSIISNQRTLIWRNVYAQHQDSLSNVNSAKFTYTSNFLISQTTENTLKIINLNSGKISSPGICPIYSMHPSHDWAAVALTSDNGEVLRIYDFNKNKPLDIVNLPNASFKRIAWNKNGDKLAFLFQREVDKPLNVGVYDTKTETITFLMEDERTAKNNSLDIEDAEISMNDKGDRVFFYVKNKKQNTTTNLSVEVWNTADPTIQSRKKINYTDKDTPWLHLWSPESGTIIALETKEFSKTIWNPNADYALNYDPYKYEPQFHFRQFADLYIMNMNTGSKHKIVEKQYTLESHIKPSPKGNYIAYFRENHWWMYDVNLDKHTNITNGLPVSLENELLTSYSSPEPHGLSAWSSNEKEVFIYDAYDIWKISVDGKQKKKLTNGRHTKTKYRIISYSKGQKVDVNVFSMRTPVFHQEEDIFISAQNQNNFSSGFYKVMPNDVLKEIAFKDKRLTKLFPVDENRYIFQEESLNIPPSITLKNVKTNQSKKIFQSNKEWVNYKWPEKRLIHYNTDFADSLKGILIYPVNFNPEKNYPMVVLVYENYAFYYHHFNPPAIHSEVGFNYTNYALEDYFILLPDIVHQKNKVGKSATQCVNNAIDKVLEQEKSVDKNRLGLIGHSFGGFETAFIITQTNRFKAAVAGNGVFNLYSKYFELQNLTGQPEYVRIEKGQYRMKDAFFENKETYLENSPIHHFDKVNTPMLIWAGKQDDNINSTQSLQGFLALRRLQKPGVMYLYENEGHSIDNNNNQKDLANRIKNWFDTHLK